MMTPTAAPSVLRDKSFRTYFKAVAVSAFGDAVSLVAIPLTAASTMAATPAEMGYLTALPWLPFVVLSIHAGYLTDRIGRRRAVMVASDLARFVLYASVPVSYVLGILTLVQLYVVVLLAGACTVFFAVSDASVLGSIVPGGRYVSAQS